MMGIGQSGAEVGGAGTRAAPRWHRALRRRGEWRRDGVTARGTPEWDYFVVFRVPPGHAWRVRAWWPLALAVRLLRGRFACGRGPAPDEVWVNLGQPGPLLRGLVRLEYH
jgi:hypothetical protein